MTEISELILLNKQHQEQMAVLRDQHREQNKQHKDQMTMLQEQFKTLQISLNNPRENVPTPMASFQPFDSTSETLFPTTTKHKIFLTSQSNSVYKMLSNLAAQQQPVKSIHELTENGKMQL